MLPRVIPTLLLEDGGLVKTVRFRKGKYIGDPINAVRLFNDMEVDELILLDITASSRGRGPNIDIIRTFASECFMPFGYGGGITSIAQMDDLFSLGVEKVIVNSAILEAPGLISEAARRYGSQSVVGAIDAKMDLFGRSRVYQHVRKKVIPMSVIDYAKNLENAGAGEILLYDVDRDGLMEGYNLQLIRETSRAVGIPVVIAGGAGSIEDLAPAVEAGASAVAAGSLFVYQNKKRGVLINYPSRSELRAHLEKNSSGK